MIRVEPAEPQKKWIVRRGDEVLGSVERFATGFMLTVETDPPTRIKRFRMIDALRQAFGESEEIHIDEAPPVEPGVV